MDREPTKLLTLTAMALVMGSVAPALAQQTNQAQDTQGQVDVVPDYAVGLDRWGYEGLYEEGAWTAEQVLDAEVYGPAGEEIGGVENIVVGTGGTIEALIIEVGGFWDIGDTHVRVPWSEVDISFENGEANVQVPMTEETVKDYDVFGGIGGESRVVDDDEPFTPRGWRVTELIDDYVTLAGGVRYGWVEDLVFDQVGRSRLWWSMPTTACTGLCLPVLWLWLRFPTGLPLLRAALRRDRDRPVGAVRVRAAAGRGPLDLRLTVAHHPACARMAARTNATITARTRCRACWRSLVGGFQ